MSIKIPTFKAVQYLANPTPLDTFVRHYAPLMSPDAERLFRETLATVIDEATIGERKNAIHMILNNLAANPWEVAKRLESGERAASEPAEGIPVIVEPGEPLRCAKCELVLIAVDGDWTHVCPQPKDAPEVVHATPQHSTFDAPLEQYVGGKDVEDAPEVPPGESFGEDGFPLAMCPQCKRPAQVMPPDDEIAVATYGHHGITEEHSSRPCAASGDPVEWTPELVEAFNDFHAAALKPDTEVRPSFRAQGTASMREAIKFRALALVKFLSGEESATIHSDQIGYIRRFLFLPWNCEWNGIVRDVTAELESNAPSTAPPADEGNEQPWAIMEVEPPPLGRLVEVCRVTGGGIDNRHPRVRRWGGDWWLDLHSKSVGENANAWKFWRDVRVEALDQPKADEGEWHKTADDLPLHNVRVEVRGGQYLRSDETGVRELREDKHWHYIDGKCAAWNTPDWYDEWRYIADQPKADATAEPDEARMPLFLHSDCAAVCQFEGMVDSHNARVAERDEAMKMCKGWQREATNSYDKYREVKAERDTAYRQRNDLIRQRDEIRAENEGLKTWVTQLQREKQGLESRHFDPIKIECDELRAQLAQANAEKVAAMGEATKAQDSVRELKGRIDGMVKVAMGG